MKNTISAVLLCTLAATLASACSKGDSKQEQNPREMGTLALPLVTYSPSGTQYRLRNANFEITGYSHYYDYDAGSDSNYRVISSEEAPDDSSIQVELEQGDYYIYLEDGWGLESVTNGVATPVEATLLSSQAQWVYVYRHSTSWVSFQFGVGGRSIWLNGKMNININVYDDPSQYYGSGAGGSSSYPSTSVGGSWSSGGATYY